MKLLVSDYDGTIKTYDRNPDFIEKYIFNKNIKSINNFIKNNKFVIATGRCTESIINETKKYNILYNYLISYNGRVIVDKNNDIINAEYINKNFIKELDNINIKELKIYDEFTENNNVDNAIYIYLKINNIRDVKNFLIEWKEKYPDLSISYNYIFNTFVIRKKYNKLLGLNTLLEKEKINIPNKDIITVGDEMNDLEMINHYDGYRMFISNPKLWFKTKNVTTTVNKLIKKIK